MKLESCPVWGAVVYRETEKDILKWSLRNYRPPNSAWGKRLLFDKSPWIAEVFRAYQDPACHTVVCMASAQTSKTTALLCCLLWSMCENPSSHIFGLPTEEMKEKFCRTVLNPVINLCEPVMANMPRRAGNRNGRGTRLLDSIHWPDGNFLLALPATENAMRSWTSRRLWGDECAKFQPGGIANMFARAATFQDRKIFLASTPRLQGEGAEGSEFADLWLQGTREVWAMKCLGVGCDALIPSNFKKSIVWDEKAKKGEEWDYDRVAKTTRLRCGECGYEHVQTGSNIAEMNRRGGYVQINKTPIKGIRSFRFNKISVHNSIDTWGSLAVKFLEGKKEMYLGNSQPFIDFFNLDLGEPFLLSEDFGDAKVQFVEGDGTDLGKVYLRVAGVDIQKDHRWIIIRDFAPNGNSVLRYAGRLETREAMMDLVKQMEVSPNCVGIDCAYHRERTLLFCAEHGFVGYQGHQGHGVNAVFKKWPHPRKRADDSIEENDKPYSKQKRWSFGSRHRIKAKYIEANSTDMGVMLCRLRDGEMGQVRWEVPDKAVKALGKAKYHRQIKAVNVFPQIVAATKRRYWGLVNVSKQDHLFDAEKIGLTMALRGGVIFPN